MQSNQNMSFASAISGNACNPIIISDDDLGEIAYAQTPFLSGSGKTGNSSRDSSSSSNSVSTSFSSPPSTSTNMMQHPRNTSFDTTAIQGYAHNPVIISDDDYDVHLFLSVFAGTKEPSGLSAQESSVRELVREMMGRD